MRAILLIVFTLVLFSVSIVHADIINIPADYPTIQQGINAAVSGDIVLVAPGTYVENIDFLGKAITVKSELGPRVTVVDAGQPASYIKCAVTFAGYEGPDSILDGFTLTNGRGYHYGGYSFGGGIACFSSSPTIINNTISYNLAMWGGGICCYQSEALIKSNLITQNQVKGKLNLGGGILCFDCGEIKILNNVISNNTSDPETNGMGGGMMVQYPKEENNLIANNIITGNSAGYGGGVYCYSVPWKADPKMYYNTIEGNFAGSRGGGVYVSWGNPHIYNSIIWDNEAQEDPEIASDGSPAVHWCNIKGGWPTGGNIIDADPMFIDASSGDFHLRYDSPCRDAGLTYFLDLVTEDFDGNDRFSGTDVDMGADEFDTHLYLTGDMAPGGDIQGKIVGLPGTSPVRLFIGLGGIRPTPLPTMYGDLWLLPPRLSIPLVLIPANGILAIPTTIPLSPPAPYDIPMQGLVGLDADSLSNLCVLEVR